MRKSWSTSGNISEDYYETGSDIIGKWERFLADNTEYYWYSNNPEHFEQECSQFWTDRENAEITYKSTSPRVTSKVVYINLNNVSSMKYKTRRTLSPLCKPFKKGLILNFISKNYVFAPVFIIFCLT